jgi:hypothetical protein
LSSRQVFAQGLPLELVIVIVVFGPVPMVMTVALLVSWRKRRVWRGNGGGRRRPGGQPVRAWLT